MKAWRAKSERDATHYHHSSFVSAAKTQVHEQSGNMEWRHVSKWSMNKVCHNACYLPQEHWGGGDYLTPWNVQWWPSVQGSTLHPPD